MVKWDIWAEGFLATGMEGIPAPAQCMAKGVEAASFKEACIKYFKGDRFFSAERMSHWGCHLFDNPGDARRSFG